MGKALLAKLALAQLIRRCVGFLCAGVALS